MKNYALKKPKFVALFFFAVTAFVISTVLCDNVVVSAIVFVFFMTVVFSKVFYLRSKAKFEREEIHQQYNDEVGRREKFIEAIPGMVWMKDSDGRIQSVNQFYEEVCQLDKGDIVGKTTKEIWPALLGEKFSKGDAAILSGQVHELRHRDEIGGVIFDFYRAPLKNGRGEITGTVGVAYDVTALVRALQDRDLTSKVFNFNSEGIVITDAHGGILKINSAFSKITGYQEHEVIGKNPRMLSSGNNALAVYENMWSSVIKNGFWTGEVWNKRKNGEVYPERLSIFSVSDSSGHISNFVGVFTDVSEKKRQEKKIHYLAYHDPLTGLPNRSLLGDLADHAIKRSHRKKEPMTVLVMDIDFFKNINDSLGHFAGDELIMAVAHRIQDSIQEDDILARWGGDEFVAILEGCSRNDAVVVADRILKSIAEPFALIDGKYTISLSIGVSVLPDHGETFDDLMQYADGAMHQAKKLGRNQIVVFDTEMSIKAKEDLKIKEDLHDAVKNKEFVVHYQAKHDLLDGRDEVVGYEALVRWKSPTRGVVPPILFIHVAEEAFLIHDIWKIVLDDVCAKIARQRRQGAPIPVAVNISPYQIAHSSLISDALRIIQKHNIPAHLIEFEITEGSFYQNKELTIEVMNSLKSYGFKIALDDFGTGYSAMHYLATLPVDILKIDRSFIVDMTTCPKIALIVQGIINIGKSLGFKLVAEGIEEEEQVTFLRNMGCHVAQGYYFSRPAPEEEIVLTENK